MKQCCREKKVAAWMTVRNDNNSARVRTINKDSVKRNGQQRCYYEKENASESVAAAISVDHVFDNANRLNHCYIN